MTRINNILPLALAIIAIALVAALTRCSFSQERGEFFSLPGENWIYGQELQYTPVDTACAPKIASIALAVRHTNAYVYSNLYVELKYTAADSALQVDTFNIRLADDYGHWYGKGVGVGYQLVDTLVKRKPVDLSRPIEVRHIMRADTLQHIEQIGIIIDD